MALRRPLRDVRPVAVVDVASSATTCREFLAKLAARPAKPSVDPDFASIGNLPMMTWVFLAAVLSGAPDEPICLPPQPEEAIDPLPELLRILQEPHRFPPDAAPEARDRIATMGPSRLDELLLAMRNQPLPVVNWLRSAGDEIVARAVREGGSIPVQRLETLARNTQLPPQPRRIALAWCEAARPGNPMPVALPITAMPGPGPESPLTAENLSTCRATSQNGVSSERMAPTHWTPQEGMRWKTALPGLGASCPIVWSDNVIVTSVSGPTGAELHVLCYDLKSGHLRTERRLSGHDFAASSQRQPARIGGMPSPVTDGEYVVTLFPTGELAAFDMQLRPLWFRSLQDEFGSFESDDGRVSSPVIQSDHVLLQVDQATNGYLISLDLDSGRLNWKVSRSGNRPQGTTPVVDATNDAATVLCGGDGQIVANDVDSGRQLWTIGEPARDRCSAPTIAHRHLVVASEATLRGLTLSEVPGRPPRLDWEVPTKAGYRSAGVLAGDFYFNRCDQGEITCHSVRTGEQLWRQPMPGGLGGSPVVAGGNVYFTNREGLTVVLAPERQYREVGRGDLGEAIAASPAVSEGCLIFRTNKHLVCVANCTP